jgi:polygalacturonase
MKWILCLMMAAAALLPADSASTPLLATGDGRDVTRPTYPPVCQTLTAQFTDSQRSSPPSGDDTVRLQAALNSCAGTGQSVVLARSGPYTAFFSGSLTLTGQALVVNGGVTLFGSNGYSNQLVAVTGANSAIMGPGSIDGRGDLVSGTPRLINANNITNFIVYNVTLRHAAKMHLYVNGGSGFTAWKITIATPANTKNTDGIDIDSVTNATVYGSFIEDGDDGVAIKTNLGPASNITIDHNTFHGTHGMSIGSQTMYGVTNVLWRNNAVYGTDEWGNVSTDNNGINIKSDLTCGGTVQQVTYSQTCMTGVKHLVVFNSYYGACSGVPGYPYYTDIVVNGVLAKGSQSGAYSEFNGYDAGHSLGLTLENLQLDLTGQQSSQYANIGLYRSNITPSGTGVTTFPVSGSGIVPKCQLGVELPSRDAR